MASQAATYNADTAMIDADTIADYQRDGAVCIRGAFKGWVDTIAAGIERNMQNRSATASDIANGNAAVSSTTTATGSAFPNSSRWCANRRPRKSPRR